MLDIIISADYEVFGNGTGDVLSCLVSPTNELLSVCDEFGAKLTLFFEIVEWWAFKKAEAEGKLTHLDYSPAENMKEQAQRAVANGHDVQLHPHPQWLQGEYTSQGWNLNHDYWRLPNVPHGLGDVEDALSLRGLLFQGKRDLEAMLKTHAPDYECIALRAGGWCIQPARDVLRAMEDVGLAADSSVFKGGYLKEKPYNVDFRDAYSECLPWRAHPEDINKVADSVDDGRIWELPIYACQKRRIETFGLRWLLREVLQIAAARRPAGCTGESMESQGRPSISVRSLRGLIGYLFEPVAIRWDFCDLGSREMFVFLTQALRKYGHEQGYLPLVMTGHPKDFANAKPLRSFLKRVRDSRAFADGQIRFSTMRRAVRTLMTAGET